MAIAAQTPAAQLDAATHSQPRRKRVFEGTVVYTTSGAIDTTNSSLPSGVTVTKPTGTGLYRLTIPAGARMSAQLTHWDASGGADRVTGKSLTASTGVLDYTVVANGSPSAAADATSGDSTTFLVVVDT